MNPSTETLSSNSCTGGLLGCAIMAVVNCIIAPPESKTTNATRVSTRPPQVMRVEDAGTSRRRAKFSEFLVDISLEHVSPRSTEGKIVRESQADTSAPSLTFSDIRKQFEKLFAFNSLRVSKITATEDGSRLFEFLAKQKACVDVYPSGVVVVIIRKDIDAVYEFAWNDAEEITSLLKHAGV